MAKKGFQRTTPKVRGVSNAKWTGEYRNMLWVPDDKRQEGPFMKLVWTLVGIAAVLCAPFVNIVCWCKSGALPLVLSCIGLKCGEDGEVEVDPDTTNFEDLQQIDRIVPDYTAASFQPAIALVEAGLVRECLAAKKDRLVPGFLYRGEGQIQELGNIVVEDYGTDLKVLDYETGDWIQVVMIEKPSSGRTVIVGVAHPDKGIASSFCIQTSEYALRFPESPLLIARAKVGEERGLAVAQAYVKVIRDVYVGKSYLGWAFPQNATGPHRPSPRGGARAGAAVLAAVGAFLPSTHAYHRQRKFDDLEIVTSCGPGEWPTAILTLHAYAWLVVIALLNDIPVPEPKGKREKKAVAAAREALTDDAQRAEIEALLAKQLPPVGLSAAGRASVEAALKKGVRGNKIVVATEGAHALCTKDSELRAVLKYLEMRQNERAAVGYDAVAKKMQVVVGAPRWACAESHGNAMAMEERVAAAKIPSEDVSWVSVLAKEAEAELEAKKKEEATFVFAVGRAVHNVIERAPPPEYVLFSDVRAAVAERLRADAPHFGEEIEQLATAKGRSYCVQTLVAALQDRGYTLYGERLQVRDARLCERLPAVAGAAPSSPRTAPVSPRVSPRCDGPLPPVDVRADRSRSRDEKSGSDESGADSGGGGDSSGDEWAPS